jgi:hypothetical protein
MTLGLPVVPRALDTLYNGPGFGVAIPTRIGRIEVNYAIPWRMFEASGDHGNPGFQFSIEADLP